MGKLEETEIKLTDLIGEKNKLKEENLDCIKNINNLEKKINEQEHDILILHTENQMK
jgi:hypothetical protein